MNHILLLPPPTTGFGTNFLPAIRALPSATLPWFIAAVVCSTMAMAIIPGMSWWQEPPEEAAPAVLAPVREAAKAVRGKLACDACGVVETIRRFEPVGKLAGGYELTVRMRDGTTRVSSIASSAKWHIGDRIMLIGGAPAPGK